MDSNQTPTTPNPNPEPSTPEPAIVQPVVASAMPETPQTVVAASMPEATPPVAAMPSAGLNQTPNLFAGSPGNLDSPVFCWLLTIITLAAVFLFMTVFSSNLNIWVKVFGLLALSLGSSVVSLRAYVATQKPGMLLSLIISVTTFTLVLLVGSWSIYIYESLKSAFSGF